MVHGFLQANVAFPHSNREKLVGHHSDRPEGVPTSSHVRGPHARRLPGLPSWDPGCRFYLEVVATALRRLTTLLFFDFSTFLFFLLFFTFKIFFLLLDFFFLFFFAFFSFPLVLLFLFAVFLLCVLRARYDLLLDTKGLCITWMSLCSKQCAMYKYGVWMVCGSNTPPDECGQNYLHLAS